MKLCKTCQVEKQDDCFERTRKSLRSECRDCRRSLKREWEKARRAAMTPEQLEEERRKNRKRDANNREYRRAILRANYAKNKEAYALRGKKARNSVEGLCRRYTENAEKIGLIVKPDTCSRCGVKPETDRYIHAHHHDYTKPLEIEWLCTTCHGAEHSGANHWRAKKATAPTERISA